ncbi:MAG: hypothetical protein EHM39_02645 [Chloroflexi bacterium]|nr:MAG: hypothetical protein EHM39_02645 [Chloroflexota bacterium]
MGGTNLLFNFITLVFVTLTILVAVVVLMVAGGSMESPILPPDETLVPPTQWSGPTVTPSLVPGIELTQTAEATPEPGS